MQRLHLPRFQLPLAALALSSAALALSSAALAQGGDDCASPTVISGSGTFAVNTITATTSSQQSGACPTAFSDVWFLWTSTVTGALQVSTCGGVGGVDSVLAVYATAACPTAAQLVACNDDTCGLESSVNINATSGSTYMIQLGGYNAASVYNATFSIGTAPPSLCVPPAAGPDVIVGDIPDILNIAASGGLDGLAVGTTSCNIGDVWLNWIASTNQHPVIGMNLYKYKVVSGAGRFENIGISWLKHGFYALSDNLCCTCTPTDGTHLGIGCSDPYGAGLNGSQASLGPRWQVNAATGVFTYPPANPGWSGTGRLCEMAGSDLEPSSASVRYYAEAQYVTPDDAAAGNQNNNASWREVVVTGAFEVNFALTGPTHRMESAIRIWPTLDAGVTLTDVQVDGLFVVGSQATDLGGGITHYEYAVYNMNSDRCGGTFSVPVPAGASISNIGFHDVTYRNGDGPGNVSFSHTDWTASVSGGAITWSTEPQAVNASANALRWGSTYNFRFDANVAPSTGIVTIGLWKSGSPGTVPAAAEIPGTGVPFHSFCWGDGTGTACPCGNSGAAGNGCASSVNAAGANLAGAGNASISGDTLVLNGSGMPDSSALYFQGTTQVAGGAGSAFGDGLRCAGGTVIRLGTQTNVSGSSQFPGAGDPSISVQGAIVVGATRTYQVWYRNAAAFCTVDTFNLSNGLQTTWGP